MVYSPEKEALVDVKSNLRFSYADLNNKANQVANFLKQTYNFSKGDRCAVLAFNDYRYWLLFFGVQKLGGIFVGLNWRLSPYELQEMLKDTTPKALFYDKNTEKTAKDIESKYKKQDYVDIDSIFKLKIPQFPITNPEHPNLSNDDPI